ncbi:GTPase Der, partial [Tetrabaena socialis]
MACLMASLASPGLVYPARGMAIAPRPAAPHVGPLRRVGLVSAPATHAPSTPSTGPPVPADQLPPAHARAAVAAARRRAKAAAAAEESAAVLGSFLGLGPGDLAPGAAVELDREQASAAWPPGQNGKAEHPTSVPPIIVLAQVLGVLEAVWRHGDAALERALYGHAAAVTDKFCGGSVFYRGLIEFSNVCQNDCGYGYCGIRNNQDDAIVPTGREIALERGANVVMPILTPTKYRESYQLYEGKPCITDTAVQCRRCLDMRLHSVGKTSAAGVWGDPASYLHPVTGLQVPHDPASPALAAAEEAHLHEMGATPLTPIRLERLVQVPYADDPEDHGHAHGSGPRNAHTPGDSHAPAAAVVAAASRPGAAPTVRRPPASSLRPFSRPLASGSARRMAVAPLRPPAAATSRAPHRRAAPVCAAAAPSTAAAPAPPSSEGAGSTTVHGVPRINIGVFGIMNAGKSTLVNALSQQEACIVDSTPGTTADVKTVLLELHALGPAKLLDTAGLDEAGALGEKKRRKALSTLKECDVAVIVVDTETLARARSLPGCSLADVLGWEQRVMAKAVKYGVSPVLLLNVKGTLHGGAAEAEAMLAEVHAVLDPERKAGARLSPRWGKPPPGCLPRWCLGRNAMLLMVVPMDAETPQGRLLRPQAMEEAIRHWATVLSVRLDLDAARGKLGPEAREAERERFGAVVRMLAANQGPSLVAVDVVHPWTLDAQSGQPLVPFTTFSIAMAYQQSGGRLDAFVEGVEALDHLQ